MWFVKCHQMWTGTMLSYSVMQGTWGEEGGILIALPGTFHETVLLEQSTDDVCASMYVCKV